MTDTGPAESGATVGRRRTVNDLLVDARARLERLEPAAAHRAVLDDGAVLVDTRCAELRRETGVVPGSVHVPLSVLYWRVDPSSGHDDPRLSNPAAWLVLLCAHGYSSTWPQPPCAILASIERPTSSAGSRRGPRPGSR